MLILKGVSKAFQQRGQVLNDLFLEINHGETVSVMGPSGSGKSTLLNLIALLDKPDSGNILFNNKEISTLTPDESAAYRNRNIGFVFQDHHMLPYLTLYENIVLPSMAGNLSVEETGKIKERISALMNRVGISSISGKYPHQVSGGEAQRASIVRALVNSPSLLLADEPTGALDSANGEILGDLLKEMNLQTGITILVATHSPVLAGKMSRRLNLLNGKLFPAT